MMDPISKAALKDIVAAVIGVLPYGALFGSTAREAVDVAISALREQERSAVQSVTDDLFRNLTENAKKLSPEDPGRALSAAQNVLDTIRQSELDAECIIDCGLDPSQVYEYLLKYPPIDIKAASGGRQKIYYGSLELFSQNIVDAVVNTPYFQRRVYQRLLRNQNKILQLIEQEKK